MPTRNQALYGHWKNKSDWPKHSAHFEGAHSAGWKVGVKMVSPPGADRRGGYLRTGGISLVRRGRERIQVEEKHRVVSSGNPSGSVCSGKTQVRDWQKQAGVKLRWALQPPRSLDFILTGRWGIVNERCRQKVRALGHHIHDRQICSLKCSSVYKLQAMFDGYLSMETGHGSEARTVCCWSIHIWPVQTQANWDVEKGSQVLNQGWTERPQKFFPNRRFHDSKTSPVAQLGSVAGELPWAANGLRLK